MRNNFSFGTRAAALAVCALSASLVYAEQRPNVAISVPFEFAVSGKTMPAGSYTISSANTLAGSSVFLVRNGSTGTSALAVMPQRSWQNAAGAAKPEVVFGCAADACSLRELKIPGWDGFVASPIKANAAQRERLVALEAKLSASGK